MNESNSEGDPSEPQAEADRALADERTRAAAMTGALERQLADAQSVAAAAKAANADEAGSRGKAETLAQRLREQLAQTEVGAAAKGSK